METEELSAILAKHRLLFLDEWADKCSCGWADSEADDNPAYLASHRAHVAQMVLESDWLRGELDKAWCNGYHAGDCGEPDNPYRADRCRRRGHRQHDRPDVDVQQSETWTGSPKNTKQTK